MSAYDAFAKLIGVRVDQADDALRSERAARATLSRRGFGAVAAALVVGTAFSFAAHEEMYRLPSSVGLPDGAMVWSFQQDSLYVFMRFLSGDRHSVDGLNIVRPMSGSGLWVRMVDRRGEVAGMGTPVSQHSEAGRFLSMAAVAQHGRAETS